MNSWMGSLYSKYKEPHFNRYKLLFLPIRLCFLGLPGCFNPRQAVVRHVRRASLEATSHRPRLQCSMCSVQAALLCSDVYVVQWSEHRTQNRKPNSAFQFSALHQ